MLKNSAVLQAQKGELLCKKETPLGREYLTNALISESKDLFEKIRDDLGLMYISDIPRYKDLERLIHSVEQINAFAYQQEQWKDLLLYILKTE